MSLDWDKDLKEEDGKDQNEEEGQKDSEMKTLQISPRFSLATTFTPQHPKSSIEQLSRRSSVTPEKEDKKYNTLVTLLGHEGKETREDID